MSRSMKRRTIVVLISLVILLAMAWQHIKGGYGVGVDSVSWLPAEARNISYIDQFLGCRIAEFDIEREPFEAWCRQAGKPLQELAGEPQTVFRCLPWLERTGAVPPITEPNEFLADELRMKRHLAALTEGDLFYEERWSNGGGYTLAYDVERQRGYYFYSHH